jgi:hypothetical protein
MAAAGSIRAARGVLVTSDEPTIVFISVLSENMPATERFILRKLDTRNLLIKREAIAYIKQQLAARLLQTTFDEDEEEGQPVTARP